MKHIRNIGKYNRIVNGILILVLCLCACGCGNKMQQNTQNVTPAPTNERVDTGFVLTTPDSYDSADTAILISTDDKESTVTLLNLNVGKKYTLNVDGTTRFYDKYGDGISFDQIKPGDIVYVTFLKSKKHLTTLAMAKNSWSYKNVDRFEMNSVRGEISIGSEIYKVTSNTQYFSGNRSIDMRDINPSDQLSFQGIDSQVLSVVVEKGHGYLRLANDENFVGGWIEIGQSMVKRITEDMLLLVPEGSYQVSISNKGGGGLKNVIINRNEETVLDIGDLTIPEPQYGMVLFSLDPASAQLYIDGTQVDASAPVTLLYGMHQLIARAEGYQSITQYIRVAQESAGINVVLDANENKEEEKSSDTSAESVTDYYKIYVDAPEKAEVYLDGNYVGITPCSFRKVEGAHIITLRRTGYETRSYTIQIEDDKKDLSFSFAELIQMDNGSEASKESSVESKNESSEESHAESSSESSST